MLVRLDACTVGISDFRKQRSTAPLLVYSKVSEVRKGAHGSMIEKKCAKENQQERRGGLGRRERGDQLKMRKPTASHGFMLCLCCLHGQVGAEHGYPLR